MLSTYESVQSHLKSPWEAEKLPSHFFVSKFFQLIVTNYMCPTTYSNNNLNRSLLWSFYHGLIIFKWQFNAFSFCVGHVHILLTQSADSQICSRIVLKGEKNHSKGKKKVKHRPDHATLTSRCHITGKS